MSAVVMQQPYKSHVLAARETLPMFRAYNLTLSGNGPWISRDYKALGEDILKDQEAKVRAQLSSRVPISGPINASAMQDEWFPSIPSHIFLSHSHSDREEVLQLAAWLRETFGLNAFIDSAAWGYANDLLKRIDNSYCVNEGGNTYSYEKRNGTTAHVHAMLSAALLRMIDSTECLFFINTPRSVHVSDSTVGQQTYSAWIYTELSAAHIMRRLTPGQHREMEKASSAEGRRVIAERREFTPAYNVNTFLSAFTEVNSTKLFDWKAAWVHAKRENALGRRAAGHPLDVLYSITTPQEIQ